MLEGKFASPVPRHVAIIMDGNGRWAQRQNKPRSAGHRAGVQSVRAVVRRSAELGVQALTLFAFSEENWQRPKTEVLGLLELFNRALRKEAAELHDNNVRLQFIGDLRRFKPDLQRLMHDVTDKTAVNTGLLLTIAVNYSGRWDFAQAARQLAHDAALGRIKPAAVDEAHLEHYMCLSGQIPPDLLIRTGGEKRLSNFLLWQIAYTELIFTDILWPDFREAHLDAAINDYASRERRFGQTSDQVAGAMHA